MAKSKSIEPSIGSWEEADQLLKDTAEYEIVLNEIEAEMNIQINEIKEKAAKMAAPILKNIKNHYIRLQQFTEENRQDLSGKSKQLNFGKVGFRKVTAVSIPKNKSELLIKNLKKFNMTDCIITKESINKEILIRYPDKDIAKIGASLKTSDKFYLETDKEKLK